MAQSTLDALHGVLGLATLVALVGSGYFFSQWRKIRREYEQLLHKQESDSKILFLQSRFASMGETVGNIAHQWKQPLNAIGSIQNSIKASLLFHGEISKAKLLDSVDTSFRLLRHLGETIDTFYAFLSHKKSERQNFQIAEVLESIRKITEYSFDNSRIRLLYRLQANLIIDGSPNELTHALLNLILNAKDVLDDTKPRLPTINVNVSGNDHCCTIIISDNGGGVRFDPPSLIFEMHISSKTDGSGLGLFMSKKIIENRFGGSISVANQNGGATFTITLPYARYGEYFLQSEDKGRRETLEQINRLSNKIIELEEIEKTLKKWADIFMHAHWGIALHIGKSNNFELTNNAFYTLYGYTQAELKKLTVPDLFTQESLPALAVIQKEAFETGYVAFESVHKRKDGSTFPVSVELIVVKSDEGEILYHIANIWDLSEQKAVEKGLLLVSKALNNTSEAVYITMGSTIIHVNDGACKMLGYSRKELTSMSVLEIDKDATQEALDTIRDDIRTRSSLRFERKHVTKEGKILNVEIEGSVFKYDGIMYEIATVRDITEQKKRREELLLREFALNRITEAVYLIDEHSMFHYINEGACEALGYTGDELLAMGVVDIDPDCTEAAWQGYWNELKTNKSIALEAYHRKKEGRLFPVEISGNYFEYNGVGYSLVVSRDITERRLLAAEKENRRIRTITENSPDIIVRFDLWGRRTYVNPKAAKLFKIDMLGKTISDATPVIDGAFFEANLHRVIRTAEESTFETSYITASGEKGWAHVQMVPEFDENGKMSSVLSIGRDITELKIKKEALKKALEFNEGIIGAIPDLLFEIAPDGTYVGVWAQDEALLFSQRTALQGKKFQDVLPPDAVAISFQALEEAAEKGGSLGKTYSLDLVHGKRWFELSVSRKKTGGNYIVLSRDITERKVAEEALLELNSTLEEKVCERTSQLRQALEFSNGVMNALPDSLFEIDINGIYLNVWARDTVSLAAQKESLLNHSLYDVLSNEAADTVMEALKEASVNGTSFGKIIKIELPHGSRYFEESVSKKASGDTFLVLSRDITERIEADKELREREEKFYKLFKLSPAAISITSLERNMYLEINDSFLLYTGFDRDEVVGRSSADLDIFVYPEERAELFRMIAEEGVVNDFRYSYRSKTGAIGYAAAYGSVILYKGERCYIGHSYDMSAYKEVEWMKQERLTLEARLSKLAAAVPGVSYIFEKTADGMIRFSYLAPTFETLFGLSIESAMQSLNLAIANLHGDDRERIERSIIATARDLSDWHEAFRIHHPQKGLLWIEGRTSPVLQEEGGIFWYGFFFDITEHKRIEKALMEREETFRAIVENSPDVICRYDLQMRRTYVNPMMRLLLGKPLEAILGTTPGAFSPLPDITAFEKLFRAVVEDKIEHEQEGPYRTPWGEIRWGNQRLVPEFDTEGNVVGVMVIGRDMTERVETEKRLKMIESAVNSSAEAVYINDKNLSIVYANDEACRMLGYTREELLRMKITQLDAKYSEQEIGAIVKTKIKEGKVVFRTRHRKKEGPVIDVEIAGSFFVHEDDEILVSVVKALAPVK